MKVLFIVRSTLYSNKGGDTIQVLQTARYLNELGAEVTIAGTLEKISYENYDLLHFFNITRPADIIGHIQKSGKPYVISPIFVDYSEFDRNFRRGLSGLVLKLLDTNGIEYAKTLARFVLKRERLASLRYLLLGQKRAIRMALRDTAMLLPNSHSEYRRLSKQYGVEKPYAVIPNAVGAVFLEASRSIPQKDPLLVLCVARIEGLKNQLNLIRALNKTRYTLLLIGDAATNQGAFYRACKMEAGANIRFLGHLAQEELVGYYLKAKVHALPSWFETTGLSSLEAAALGCSLVITDKGDTREYFGDMARYCDPASPDSIYAAVENAAAAPSDGLLQNKILSQYTWTRAAELTLAAYHRILAEK
jgi:glycosyltransferase involved in cell wall biosynthesis